IPSPGPTHDFCQGLESTFSLIFTDFGQVFVVGSQDETSIDVILPTPVGKFNRPSLKYVCAGPLNRHVPTFGPPPLVRGMEEPFTTAQGLRPGHLTLRIRVPNTATTAH